MKNDTIYRQAAIDEVVAWLRDRMADGKNGKPLTERLKALPPAQPERKPGEWIYDGDCYICNQCKSAFNWWADSQTSNFCPNCGADMRKEERRE